MQYITNDFHELTEDEMMAVNGGTTIKDIKDNDLKMVQYDGKSYIHDQTTNTWYILGSNSSDLTEISPPTNDPDVKDKTPPLNEPGGK